MARYADEYDRWPAGGISGSSREPIVFDYDPWYGRGGYGRNFYRAPRGYGRVYGAGRGPAYARAYRVGIDPGYGRIFGEAWRDPGGGFTAADLRGRMGLHDFTEGFGRFSGGEVSGYPYAERTIEHRRPYRGRGIGFTRPIDPRRRFRPGRARASDYTYFPWGPWEDR